ncbi:hypothetical protein ACFLZ9_02270 [Patescibacteria group bacterium]
MKNVGVIFFISTLILVITVGAIGIMAGNAPDQVMMLTSLTVLISAALCLMCILVWCLQLLDKLIRSLAKRWGKYDLLDRINKK